jgi:hypothetical protein
MGLTEIEEIKQKLDQLQLVPFTNYFIWDADYFLIYIWPHRYSDTLVSGSKLLSTYSKVDIILYERTGIDSASYISLRTDPRFKDYEPIQYNVIYTPNGSILTAADGNDIPINHLCELIRYIERLTNLVAFM